MPHEHLHHGRLGSGGHIDRASKGTILVVDNDPELRNVLCVRLSRAGYDSVEAGSGAQALAEWQRRSFDLVVSDLNMPGGDGIALADTLQRSENVPIIFVTGFREDFRARLHRVKDVTVLEKPLDPAALLEIVEASLVGRDTGDDGLRVGEAS
jgi:two-component system OmpR family response regulator